MSTVAGMINPSFVLSTGDQMYDYGVQNVDDQLFATHFERVYEPFRPLQIPWFMSVRNPTGTPSVGVGTCVRERPEGRKKARGEGRAD